MLLFPRRLLRPECAVSAVELVVGLLPRFKLKLLRPQRVVRAVELEPRLYLFLILRLRTVPDRQVGPVRIITPLRVKERLDERFVRTEKFLRRHDDVLLDVLEPRIIPSLFGQEALLSGDIPQGVRPKALVLGKLLRLYIVHPREVRAVIGDIALILCDCRKRKERGGAEQEPDKRKT